jgi:hypothetical protein
MRSITMAALLAPNLYVQDVDPCVITFAQFVMEKQ